MSVQTPSIVQRNFEEGTRPILELPETVARLTKTKVSTIKWQKETYVPRHKKFVSDMVGVTEDGQIIHIEQETAPEGDLSVRMLEYATLIAVAFDMKRPISQYVYYTGDEPRKRRQSNIRCIGFFTNIISWMRAHKRFANALSKGRFQLLPCPCSCERPI